MKGTNVFAAEKSPAEIGLNHGVPKILAQIAHSRPARDAPIEVRHDAGVVDQRVDLAETVGDFVNQLAHVFLVAHVGGHGERFGADF